VIRGIIQVVLVLAVLAAGGFGFKYLLDTAPRPQQRATPAAVPLVRVATVELRDVTLDVMSQGTVEPRTETTLAAEVAGRVLETGPGLETGAFFAAGDVLVQLDERDYAAAVTAAKAAVSQAEYALTWERAEAEVAIADWKRTSQAEPPALVGRTPQLARAQAELDAARARLETAQLDLTRARITAPYAGRCREKLADVGQFVTRGTALARIHAIDWAEVVLPVPDEELLYLDVPLRAQAAAPANGRAEADPDGPAVELSADFAGKTHTWPARIVRSEGEVDARTRVVRLVARVEAPYARAEGDAERPPLAVGMFVRAKIAGKRFAGVAVLDRAALHEGSRVLVLDEGDRLRWREVRVLRRTREHALVSDGLRAGERVCVSVLDIVVEGMQVRATAEAEAPR
jgi:RND family efflux transporter MFP subunit